MKKKSTIQWIAEFASIHKKTYIFSVLFAVLGVFCALAPYFVIGNMVKELLTGRTEFSYYFTQCLYMAAFWTARVVFHAISTSLSHKATFHVLAVIRQRVCDKLYKLPLGYVCDTPSGSIKNVIVERIESIETTLAHVLPEFTANLLGPVLVIIYLFTIDWRMALLSLVTIPVGMVCYMLMCMGYEESYKNTIVKTKALNDTAVEYINGIEVIKAFGKAESSYEKFVVAAREGAACFVDWMRRCNVFMSLAVSIFPAGLITILPFGGMFYQNGSLLATSFILIIIISLGLVTPILTCASYSDDIAKVRTIIGEVTDILEQEEMERPGKLYKQLNGTDIVLKDVKFGYHEKEILHGVTMQMKKGTVNALVGPSGSGKSTIAKLIAGLWDAKAGEISIGGVDVRRIPLEEQNRLIAYVAQDNYLFDMTVRENIRMGNPKATDLEVEQVAKDSGCYEFIMQLENGFDTVVGGAGGHLSGGERQRISIARAMLKNAEIIILDEATAYTDPENEAIVQSAVAKLVQGKTLLVIAHRLTTITNSDCIFVIDGGNVSASGTHEELLQISPLYKNMWESHISVKDGMEKGDEVYA